MRKSQGHFQDWEQAFYNFFQQGRDEQRAALSAADYEAAILISRIRTGRNYLALQQGAHSASAGGILNAAFLPALCAKAVNMRIEYTVLSGVIFQRLLAQRPVN